MNTIATHHYGTPVAVRELRGSLEIRPCAGDPETVEIQLLDTTSEVVAAVIRLPLADLGKLLFSHSADCVFGVDQTGRLGKRHEHRFERLDLPKLGPLLGTPEGIERMEALLAPHTPEGWTPNVHFAVYGKYAEQRDGGRSVLFERWVDADPTDDPREACA
jgi:hypothetical protein